VATFFGDLEGVLMMGFMQQGTTVMSEAYWKTLRKLHRGIQNKRHGKLTSGVTLFSDKVCPHTAACSPALLEHFSWQLIDHLS
jgi:hypothetical protein